MANRWNSEKDLLDRLGGCYFLFDGKLCMIQVYSSSILLVLDPITQNELHRIKPDDPRLDVSALELGYANGYREDEIRVTYISRGTGKNYKQGICNHNIKYQTIDGTESNGYVIPGRGSTHILNNRGFVESIEGTFPPVGAAMTYLKNQRNKSEVAVSQAVAIQKPEVGPMMVYVRTKAVGWIAPSETTVRVPDGPVSWIVERALAAVGMNSKPE